MKVSEFPHYRQFDSTDCGPFALRMIAKYYGKEYTANYLRTKCGISKNGVSMLGISKAAQSIGFNTIGVELTFTQLSKSEKLPCILHWNDNHFVVCYKITRKDKDYRIYISDPAFQKTCYTKKDFLKCWNGLRNTENEKGLALFLEPTAKFYEQREEDSLAHHKSIKYFFSHFRPFKRKFVKLFLAIGLGSILQFIMPFLTQAIIDKGIAASNLNIIMLICLGQFVLSVTLLFVGYIRNRLLLKINAQIDIALISDFIYKLLCMPLHFFESKHTGDILQRIEDQTRIKSFLMDGSMSILFSSINFIVFLVILAYYKVELLAIFLIGNILYVLWVFFFMKYRKVLDIKRFDQTAQKHSKIIQLIEGVHDIKLNNCESQKQGELKQIQRMLLHISLKSLTIEQLQQNGAVFFSQTTNILLTFIAAKNVIDGDMTIGMMMSISYIIGQLTAPISDFIAFSKSLQDARLSIDRMNELCNEHDEETDIENKISVLPINKSITIKDLNFSYTGQNADYVLKNVNLVIPEQKVTAIVGESGSGKTTMIKLLEGWYAPNSGMILVGDTKLQNINPHFWRSKIGSVTQENYIFSDTIAHNISLGDAHVNLKKLRNATQLSNSDVFIDSMPKAYDSCIGMEGVGMSQGQKQRVLIARAIYKNPEYLFFDEATNALDSTNEREIMCNLQRYYKGRTVVIAAHRLSTIINADQIVVLKKGRIIEIGKHKELFEKKGDYYQLVKNQLA